MVPISADFKEAIMQHKPVALYKPRGAAAKGVRTLAEEIGNRLANNSAKTQEAA
jgi:chromosome partitioning protein